MPGGMANRCHAQHNPNTGTLALGVIAVLLALLLGFSLASTIQLKAAPEPAIACGPLFSGPPDVCPDCRASLCPNDDAGVALVRWLMINEGKAPFVSFDAEVAFRGDRDVLRSGLLPETKPGGSRDVVINSGSMGMLMSTVPGIIGLFAIG